MDTFELLVRCGLSKKEASVYTALLENGVMSLSDINKETHINRPALYALLPKMQKNGYVSLVQKQKRIFYKAESPERILEDYSKAYEETTERLKELKTQFRSEGTERPTIKYFEGAHGIHFVFDDIAHTLPFGSTFYRYTSYQGDTKPYQNTYYMHARETKQLERLVITSEAKAAKKEKKLERTVKVIPKDFDLFEDNITLVIYGNKTAYVDYSSQTSFIVESEKIARFQEKLFKLLWGRL